MRINILIHPSCYWQLDGQNFYCAHNNIEVVKYVEENMGIEVEVEGYACAECAEPLEGSPAEDRADEIAEQQLMEILGK